LFAVLVYDDYLFLAVVEIDVKVVALLGLPDFWVDLKLPKVFNKLTYSNLVLFVNVNKNSVG
jgi:hypothetical protein